MALKLNANVSHKVCSPSSCSRVSAVLYPPASQIDRFSPCSITSPNININHSTPGAVSTSWQPVNRASVVCAATPQQSVDPLAVSDGVYRSGKTFTIHGAAELKQYTTAEPNKHKLTVLMAKSSHCRPCKKFASTYHSYAARFHESQLLEIVGDETQETRKMMVEMKVKVTPTFFLYRDGVLLETLTGTTRNALSRAIVRHLKDGEAGKDVQEEPVTALDSEDEDD